MMTDRTGTEVGGFETANALLGKLGHLTKAYQDNRRHTSLWGRPAGDRYLAGCPRLPGGRSHQLRRGRTGGRLAGLHRGGLEGENTAKVYARYGIDLSTITEPRFESV